MGFCTVSGRYQEDPLLVGVQTAQLHDIPPAHQSRDGKAVPEGFPEGGDDAEKAVAYSPDDLPDVIAFDHRKIILQFLQWKKTGIRPSVEE